MTLNAFYIFILLIVCPFTQGQTQLANTIQLNKNEELANLPDTVKVDTIVYWRANRTINNVVASYNSYLRNRERDYKIGSTIHLIGNTVDHKLCGLCYFYDASNNDLIAKTSYKNGKLHGDVFIYDKTQAVAHYIYKNHRCIGICDENGILKKIRHHVFYYPKKTCRCHN